MIATCLIVISSGGLHRNDAAVLGASEEESRNLPPFNHTSCRAAGDLSTQSIIEARPLISHIMARTSARDDAAAGCLLSSSMDSLDLIATCPIVISGGGGLRRNDAAAGRLLSFENTKKQARGLLFVSNYYLPWKYLTPASKRGWYLFPQMFLAMLSPRLSVWPILPSTLPSGLVMPSTAQEEPLGLKRLS